MQEWKAVIRVLKEHGCTTMPESLVFGRAALAYHIGDDGVREAEAWTKFPGQRLQARATWDAYLHPCGLSWKVATLDPATVRNGRYESWPAVEAACKWAARLEKGEGPIRPISIATAVYQWLDTDAPWLGLDTEGATAVERVSVSKGGYAGTFPWDALARDLVQDLVDRAELVLLYNATHDIPLLKVAGVTIPPEKVCDVMIAHTILNPWRQRGLGKSAPLYIPVQPWKHLKDGEFYSAMDAFVLPAMWMEMAAMLTERRMWPTFETDQALLFRLPPNAKPRLGKAETTVTKASGLLEV